MWDHVGIGVTHGTSLKICSVNLEAAVASCVVTLPMFLALTTGYDAAAQRRVGPWMAMYTLIVTTLVLLTGQADGAARS